MMSRRFAVMFALVASLTCLDACSDQYSAAPITAHVVDGETGKPLAGVNVVAHWQLHGGLEGGTPLGAVMVMETVTDDDGRFHFPAWGPKEVQRPSGVYGNARVQGSAPELLLFKSGYKHGWALNYHGGDPDPRNMRSLWDGKVIKLEPFHGTSAEYAWDLKGLSYALDSATAFANWSCSAGKPCPAACQWQNIPKTIQAIGRQFKAFKAEGIDHTNIYSSLMNNDEIVRKDGCASPISILQGDGK